MFCLCLDYQIKQSLVVTEMMLKIIYKIFFTGLPEILYFIMDAYIPSLQVVLSIDMITLLGIIY